MHILRQGLQGVLSAGCTAAGACSQDMHCWDLSWRRLVCGDLHCRADVASVSCCERPCMPRTGSCWLPERTAAHDQPHESCHTAHQLICAVQAEALVAALLFAAHPVHTEAVAGIVGQVCSLPQYSPSCCHTRLTAFLQFLDSRARAAVPVQIILVLRLCIVHGHSAPGVAACSCQTSFDSSTAHPVAEMTGWCAQ